MRNFREPEIFPEEKRGDCNSGKPNYLGEAEIEGRCIYITINFKNLLIIDEGKTKGNRIYINIFLEFRLLDNVDFQNY